MKNRCKEAREQAGLSVGQASRMLGCDIDYLNLFEQRDLSTPDGLRDRMVEVYGCSEEWLKGEGPDRDYATLKTVKGSEDLSDHDRDVVAKFIASLPRNKPLDK